MKKLLQMCITNTEPSLLKSTDYIVGQVNTNETLVVCIREEHHLVVSVSKL
uniref:Uncharacterized protein n=1 Tax=Arion vulgaris TaxID=1028688 RepID=A0A0B7AE80_9EUPU